MHSLVLQQSPLFAFFFQKKQSLAITTATPDFQKEGLSFNETKIH